MKRSNTPTAAEQTVRRISELRDLARRLARAGYEAGLHSHASTRLPSPSKVAERHGRYSAKRAS